MIYIINLPGDVQRRQRMDDLLRPLNLPFEFVEAVRGVELSAKDISVFDQHQTMKLSPGEIGCILSHVKVWNMICNSDDDFAVILEDDVRLADGFRDVVAGLKIDRASTALYRLETFLASVTTSTKAAQTIDRYRIVAAFSSHGGTAAYALNKKTALYLSRIYQAFEHALDIELFAPDRQSTPHVNIFQCIPAPCVQDQILGVSAEYLKSGLRGSRADERTGALKEDPWKAWKDVFRPIYLAVYSAGLMLGAKRRLTIPFG